MTKNLLLDAAILLAIAAIAGAGYQLAPLLNPKADIALPLSGCNLDRQACVVKLPNGGQVEFSIEPRPIPVLKPLQLQASFQATEVRKVEVDFSGSTMKMGYNRTQLERQSGSDRFAASASLPVCITGTMEWEATVLVDTGKAIFAIPFRFVTGH